MLQNCGTKELQIIKEAILVALWYASYILISAIVIYILLN
tara:strand:+ start:262 stop:381 length:120 start_codon:yes stop_codon:yes gene_type:complete